MAASRHRISTAAIPLSGPVPAAVTARRDLADAVTNPATPTEFALAFGVYVGLTLAVGALVLAVSPSTVRAVEDRLDERPATAGVIGVGVVVGGVVLLATVSAATTLLVGFGAPEILERVPLVAMVAASAALTVANTIGIVAVGSFLLRGVGSGTDPNRWLALVVGTVVVQLLYLVPLVNVAVALCLVALATGAILGQWWQDRGSGSADSEPRESAADG
ncbi:hypothetical protein ACT4ML_02865 [Natrinema sp. LN54]|uniref:hypothetical protein n=1 Tax=Natrinema sp. LN54 TaxID=3458705 RepID=UPI0040353868